MLSAALRLLNALSLLMWPFIVLLVAAHPEWQILFWPLSVMFALRWWWLRGKPAAMTRLSAWLSLFGAIFTFSAGALRSLHLLLWYPVLVNLLLLIMFAGSLRGPMPLVERIARLREPNLSPQGVNYTRRVTWLWSLFFLFNGSVAAATCVAGNLNWWTLWNGGVSYLLTGSLMAGEWLVRQRIRQER
ncbi:DNA gyrase subunit B [Pantoea sp. YU22]|uniref:COG4648 family protein n=1 Tax=Pantoea TaxID=53335 RepID=UPI000F86AD95|nr:MULTISPECIES: hypothetical protein [Pantoea]RTY59941.1 DNA gyrase subunit B [Pantoea sp. YU22]WBV20312.1 hypothetical protein PG877_11825 [Pantoea piersonii]